MAITRDERVPKSTVSIRDFMGMATNIDPSNLKPGVARVQINVHGIQRGQLEVRRGLRELVFEDN